MSKLKTQDQFRDIFLSKLLRNIPMQKPVIIRIPDGETQLLQVMHTIQPILKQTKRIAHIGMFHDQSLTQLSINGRKWFQKYNFNTLLINIEDNYTTIFMLNWDRAIASKIIPQNADLNARYYQFDELTPNYTISIKSSNRLKLTDYGQHTITHLFAFTDPKYTQILAGYKFEYNQANKSWQHARTFGSKADHEYGTDAGVEQQFR